MLVLGILIGLFLGFAIMFPILAVVEKDRRLLGGENDRLRAEGHLALRELTSARQELQKASAVANRSSRTMWD